MVDKSVIEIFTTQMSVTSSGLDSKDTTRDGQEGNIEGSSTQIEDENVTFLLVIGIQTVSNGYNTRISLIQISFFFYAD
jgi:hypothetical protein